MTHLRIGRFVLDLSETPPCMTWRGCGLSRGHWIAEQIFWRFYWITEYLPACEWAQGCAEAAIACYSSDGWLDTPRTVSEHLCHEHAAEAGYCCVCGLFSSGIDSFDWGDPPGMCETCRDEFEADNWEDDADTDDYLGEPEVP